MKKIESVVDLLNNLKLLNINENTFYRGHSNKSWKLIPSVFRDEYVGKEYELYAKTREFNFGEFERQESLFDKICLMQHYNIPTRLLDWTKNPLVSLYFATDGKENADGEIIILQPKSTYYSGTSGEKVMSELVLVARRNKYSLNQYINEQVDGCKLSHLNLTSDNFEKLIDSIQLIKPKVTNQRLRVQQGCFTIHGSTIKTKDHIKYIYPNIITQKNLEDVIISRLQVNKNAKEQIRQELNILGINYATLFPDLESYGTHLRKTISNKYNNNVNEETAVTMENL